MNDTYAKQVLDTVVGQVFGYQNPLSLDDAARRFAFDIRLPQQVFDEATSEPLWVASLAQSNYRSMKENQQRYAGKPELEPARQLMTMQDVLTVWGAINVPSANREIGSSNVAESDGVYNSQFVYRSVDIRKSSNILFSDGVDACEFVVAGQTSKKSAYSIRIEDSKNIVNSFSVVWSNNIRNSMFIQDCYDLEDCLFCAHLAGKRFCIGNMQYSEDEYRRIKDMVVRWTLQSQ